MTDPTTTPPEPLDLAAIRAEAASLTEDPEFERSLHIGGMEQDLARFVLDRVPALLDALDAAEEENEREHREAVTWRDLARAEQDQRQAIQAERDAAEAEVAALRGRIEVLADEWERTTTQSLAASGYTYSLPMRDVLTRLRRALAADEGEAVTHDLRRALAAARPAPAVSTADVEITTAAELDALPAGTIVRDRFGGYLAQGRDAMGVAWFHYPVYDHAGSSALVAGIGPVTVCFTPGLTVADEVRCGWCGRPAHDPADCAVAKAHESQRLADIEQAVTDEGRAEA